MFQLLKNVNTLTLICTIFDIPSGWSRRPANAFAGEGKTENFYAEWQLTHEIYRRSSHQQLMIQPRILMMGPQKLGFDLLLWRGLRCVIGAVVLWHVSALLELLSPIKILPPQMRRWCRCLGSFCGHYSHRRWGKSLNLQRELATSLRRFRLFPCCSPLSEF